MKILQITFFVVMIALLMPTCKGKSSNAENSAAETSMTDSVNMQQQKKRRGPDYSALKSELGLTKEQEKQYDDVIEKYRGISEANRASYTGADGKVDRVVMFEKMEEVSKQQTAEMAGFLTDDQISLYNEYTAKNSRKRPGYSNELLVQIKTTLNLGESESQMLEAVNKAFEKSYHDAHDIYHGNADLAAEYWTKYDEERKNALKKVFTEEQYAQYMQLVKDITAPGKN